MPLLALRVARRLNSQDVIETLSEGMLWRGIPDSIRSGNGRSVLPGSCGTGN